MPVISRWSCLWQIPDVVLPFDVEAVSHDALPSDGDAFVKYAAILASLRRHPIGDYTVSFWVDEDKRDADWEKRFQQWLIDRRDIMAEYQAAGAMPHANGPSLKTADFNTSLSFQQDLRRLVDFAESEAELYERQGNLDLAWDCHLAAIRSANHVEKPGLSMCCMMGHAVRKVAFDGIVKWACNPDLTVDQIQTARRDLMKSLVGRFPASDSVKADYLVLRNSLRAFDFRNAIPGRPLVQVPMSICEYISSWSTAEPELTLRLERQLLANTVPELDKPRYLRRPLAHSRRLVFEDEPDRRLARGQMSSVALARADEAILFRSRFRSLSSSDQQIDMWCLRAQTRQEMVLALLAAQEYQRVHGVFSESLEQLVPTILPEIPRDAMDPAGSAIRYRRDPNGGVVIWSVGDNAVNDDGKIDGKSPLDLGYDVQVGARKTTSELLEGVNE